MQTACGDWIRQEISGTPTLGARVNSWMIRSIILEATVVMTVLSSKPICNFTVSILLCIVLLSASSSET